MGRRERAVGPLERAGTVDLVPVPLATVGRAVLRRQLAVALAVPLEPLPCIFGTITIPVLADAVALAVDHLALEHFSFCGSVVVVMF